MMSSPSRRARIGPQVGVGLELRRGGEPAMDPRLEPGVAELVPDGLLRTPANADPEGPTGLQGMEERQAAGLGRRVAGRNGELLPQPAGEEDPGIRVDRVAAHPPLEPLRAGRPARRVADGEQQVERTPDLVGPEPADPVDLPGIEQPGERKLILHLNQAEGFDPAPPPQQGRQRPQHQAAVGPGGLPMGFHRLGQRGLQPLAGGEHVAEHGRGHGGGQAGCVRLRLHTGHLRAWSLGRASGGTGSLSPETPRRAVTSGRGGDRRRAGGGRIGGRSSRPGADHAGAWPRKKQRGRLRLRAIRGEPRLRVMRENRWAWFVPLSEVWRLAVLRFGRYPGPRPRSVPAGWDFAAPGFSIVWTYLPSARSRAALAMRDWRAALGGWAGIRRRSRCRSGPAGRP